MTRNEDLAPMKVDPTWWPELEIVRRDQRLVARLALRGIAKDDLSVFVDDGGLVVEGERKSEHARFRRPIPLTDGVSPEDVSATFSAGFLELTVPAPSAATARPPRKVSKRALAIGPDPKAGKIIA